MSTYETVAGTQPDIDEQHQPRTIKRIDGDATEHLMTEIGDGVFVQWSTCTRCSGRVSECRCPDGPKEPAYIEGWRVNRLADSFKGRGVEPALPITHKAKDRRINAVLRLLRAEGWTITNPRGDSLSSHQYVVDTPTDVQRDMVAAAIQAVSEAGDDPEGPADDPDNLTGMDLGEGAATICECGLPVEDCDRDHEAEAFSGSDLAARHPDLVAEATEDDLEFARDTLGPTASDDEVQALADDRAVRDARELLKEREDQFDAGF